MRFLIILFSMLSLLFCACIRSDQPAPASDKPSREINEVLKAHSDELLALPEVVGFYVGQLDDGRPCITLMLKDSTKETATQIPRMLEGHPVTIHVTGEIRTMK